MDESTIFDDIFSNYQDIVGDREKILHALSSVEAFLNDFRRDFESRRQDIEDVERELKRITIPVQQEIQSSGDFKNQGQRDVALQQFLLNDEDVQEKQGKIQELKIRKAELAADIETLESALKVLRLLLQDALGIKQ